MCISTSVYVQRFNLEGHIVFAVLEDQESSVKIFNEQCNLDYLEAQLLSSRNY